MSENILYPSRDLLRSYTRPLFAILFVACGCLVLLQQAHAEEGMALHAENCVACHAAMTGGEGSVLYTREDRTVKSKDALNKQVHRCQSSLGLDWSNDQISSVENFLNTTFYKF